jgi:hypothetical protein
VGGESGVAAVLDTLTRDVARVLAFCGIESPGVATRDLVRSAPGP